MDSPPGFAHSQNSRAPVLDHPWFRFARTHTTSGTGHQIPLPRDGDAVAIDLASQYGFKSCLIVPTPAGVDIDRSEMLCLGSDRADDFEGAKACVVRTLARSPAAELHDWLKGYLQQQLRALALEWQGRGTNEISLRTGMSAASVDSRFQRINARLNCAS